MSCTDVRQRITGGTPRTDPSVAAHLGECSGCAGYADRLDAARAVLRASADVLPDPHFATRVLARLPRGRADLLGWAALRVLPAATALVLVLFGWCWIDTPDPLTLFTTSPTDLVTWAGVP